MDDVAADPLCERAGEGLADRRQPVSTALGSDDADGNLVSKSATIDFENWYRESYGEQTPWGAEDTPAFVTAVETELERDLSSAIMTEGGKLPRRRVEIGEALVEQGEEGNELLPAPGTVCSMSRSTGRRSLRWGPGPCSARTPSSREAGEPRRYGP